MFIVLFGPELLRWNRWCIVKSSLSSNWLRGSLKFPREHWCCSSFTWRNTEAKLLCIICFVRIHTKKRKWQLHLKKKNPNNNKCSLFLNQISLIIRLLYVEEGSSKYTQCLVSSSPSSTAKARQNTNHHVYIYLTIDQITTWFPNSLCENEFPQLLKEQ